MHGILFPGAAPPRSARHRVPLTAPFLLAASAAVGQSDEDGARDADASSLETIVVTGAENGLGDAQAELALTPGGADLVDLDDFRERSVSSMGDVLRYVPGIWAASDAGTDDMFFSSRGSNLDATDYDMNGLKLLQDGLPVTMADGSNHNRVIDPLSARYAVVARGANALKHGASTLGGAINFVSPTARDFPAADASVSAGSHGQMQGRATVSREFDERRDALLTLEGKRWDGYREHNDHRRAGIYANAGWRFSDSVATRVYGTYVENDQQLPGALTRAEAEAAPGRASLEAIGGDYQRDVETWRLAGRTRWQLAGRRDLKLGLSIEEQSLFHPIVDQIFVDPDGAGPEPPVEVFSLLIDTDHRNAGATLRYSHELDDHDLLLGVDYAASTEDGAHFRNLGGRRNGLSAWIDNDAAMLEAFVMDRWRLSERTTVVLAAQGVSAARDVRTTDVETGESRNPNARYSSVNPRAGVIFSPAGDVDLYANVSRLYEPPTNFELEDNVVGGDATLDAMHGTVAEIGTRGAREFGDMNRWSWDAALYHARIEEEILSVEDPEAPGTSLVTNVDETLHAGAEVSLGADFTLDSAGSRLIEARLSLSLNEFRFDGDARYTNNALPAAPEHVARGEVLYRGANGFYAGPTFDKVGARYADFSNSYRIEPYSSWGLRGGWASNRWSTFFEIRNLADTRYIATHGVRTSASSDDAILNPGRPRSAVAGFSVAVE